MPTPAPSRFAQETLHQQFLALPHASRPTTHLGVFAGRNAPRPASRSDRLNHCAERIAQMAIAALIGALIVYGYAADAAAMMLARV
jgi:hypothetical protein